MKNYFLGIGIDRYEDGYIHQLKSAVRDVEKIEELLIEYYLFDSSNSILLLNEKAKKESIIKQVYQYHLIDEKFNLVIYFAGHGKLDKEHQPEEGYILPYDANDGETESYINQRDLLGRLEKIDNCHHLLLLWDSCFSGSLFDVATRQGSTGEINYFTYPSRYAFTSGRKYEKVKDGGAISRSPFSDAITGILTSQTGRDIPITELATRLMPHFVGFKQNPICGALLMKGHSWGEFVFESKVPEDAFNIEPNIISPAVPPPVVFFGREQELYAIRHNLNALANRNRILLLHAEGGMGKTSLAAMYWQINKFRYRHLAWLFCGNGIYEEALPQLAYMLDIDLSQGQNLVFALCRKLKNMKDPILLVLDNANEANEIKKFNEDFGKLGLHVLITSRCRNIMVNPVEEMLIDHLSPDLARNLFIEYYREDNEEFDSLLDQFLNAISYHTLLIEVFAKNLQEASSFGSSGLSMKSFLQKLENSGLFLKEKSFEMYTDYTGYVKKDAVTTDDILNILYDFSKLKGQERVILVNFSLLPVASYDIPFLLQLMNPADQDQYGKTLKKLFRMGWIGGGGGTYRISPVIQKLVIEKKEKLCGRMVLIWLMKSTPIWN